MGWRNEGRGESLTSGHYCTGLCVVCGWVCRVEGGGGQRGAALSSLCSALCWWVSWPGLTRYCTPTHTLCGCAYVPACFTPHRDGTVFSAVSAAYPHLNHSNRVCLRLCFLRVPSYLPAHPHNHTGTALYSLLCLLPTWLSLRACTASWEPSLLWACPSRTLPPVTASS